jgi:DNA modification methylase
MQLDSTCVHDWYRFVLAYPDHLVSSLVQRFNLQPHHVVLDPFVGTGTTLVECKKLGIDSIGVDANPVTAFASRVKTRWDIDIEEFEERQRVFLKFIKETIGRGVREAGVNSQQMTLDSLLPQPVLPSLDEDLVRHVKDLMPKNAMSTLPLHKVLVAAAELDAWPDDEITDLFRLVLASVAVHDMSNVGFGPEIYVKRKRRKDADLYAPMSRALSKAKQDLRLVQQIEDPGIATVYQGDARYLTRVVDTNLVDCVITSPPYPNEKDYTRITRLELTLLGFIADRSELRQIKYDMLRSHTRNIYKDDNDSLFVADVSEIQEVAAAVEKRRVERGATSGFERLYHRVVTEYFGGMYRVLEQLQHIVRSGGKVALVVGDQMSFFRVPIRTAELLSIVARRKLHFKEIETLTWRSRLATATKREIEEHILILERE